MFARLGKVLLAESSERKPRYAFKIHFHNHVVICWVLVPLQSEHCSSSHQHAGAQVEPPQCGRCATTSQMQRPVLLTFCTGLRQPDAVGWRNREVRLTLCPGNSRTSSVAHQSLIHGSHTNTQPVQVRVDIGKHSTLQPDMWAAGDMVTIRDHLAERCSSLQSNWRPVA